MKKFSIAVLLIIGLLIVPSKADNPHGPSVVATASYHGYSSSVGTTTLYTPSVDGMYLVLMYGRVRSGGDTTVAFTTYWTDTWSAQNTSSNYSTSGGGGVYQDQVPPIPMFVTSGNPIQFSTLYSGNTSMSAYDVDVVVIKE